MTHLKLYTLVATLAFLFFDFAWGGGKLKLNSSKWVTRNVRELTCEGMEDWYNKKVHDEAKVVLYNKKMYKIMSSMQYLQSISMKHTGSPCHSTEKLKAACLTVTTKRKSSSIISRGSTAFGIKARCTENSNRHYTCKVQPTNKSAMSGYKYDVRIVHLWTDGDKYTLRLACINDDLIWSLHSTSKEPVNQHVKKIVFRKIKDVGFNPKNYIEIPHDSC